MQLAKCSILLFLRPSQEAQMFSVSQKGALMASFVILMLRSKFAKHNHVLKSESGTQRRKSLKCFLQLCFSSAETQISLIRIQYTRRHFERWISVSTLRLRLFLNSAFSFQTLEKHRNKASL